MTATAQPQKKSFADAIFYEPLQLALDQPPQLLISAASVFLVAAEASILIDAPWNVFLAIGAEWAYLRGLCSGQAAKTRWAAALIWAAVILVIAYGSLWGLRKFHLVPAVPPAWAAVLLTALHIGCISAVTLCSAMCHRAELIARRQVEERDRAEAEERKKIEAEGQERQARADADLEREIGHKRAIMQLELERQWKEQQLAQAAVRAQVEIEMTKKQQLAAMRSVRAQQPQIASRTAANTPPNTDREQLRAQIVRTLREQPNPNKSELARSLGIGRTLLYELIAEARQRGDLPKLTRAGSGSRPRRRSAKHRFGLCRRAR
jgi:hypothetical protein